MRQLLVLLVTLSPTAALACGGLFCNNAQPVNQAAERILFSHSGGMVDMDVRITYSGPSTDFAWILPAPRDVETALSSEGLFQALDRNFAPRFILRTDFEGDCWFGGPDAGLAAPDASVSQDASAGPPPVQVLSREEIGPYDRVILDAPNVEALRDWLDANEFAIPEGIDEKLAPYIELDAVFVAIKLLAGQESGDIVPLHLRFSGDRPAIPIIPTAVAATPDMGIIVHVLGQNRAIPVNYLHVQVNEAAIDWQGSGQNYPDVVSAAADEAGGHAFVTDYAGPVTDGFRAALTPYPEAFLQNLAATETWGGLNGIITVGADPDFSRVAMQFVDEDDLDWDTPLDGAALAEAVREELQPVRERLQAVMEASPYLTRLYTTLSPEEMDTDPVFSFNPDLDEVANVRTAVRTVTCVDGEEDWDNAVITLPSGAQLGGDVEPVQRQAGETVRGEATPAAAVVEQFVEAGPGVWVSEMPPLPSPPTNGGGNGTGSGDAGCGCDSTGSGGGLPMVLGLLALFGFGARRWR